MDWVSIEDRLPNEFQKVLTYREDGEIMIDLMMSKDVWLFELDEWDWNKVTHWMELPKAPKNK